VSRFRSVGAQLVLALTGVLAAALVVTYLTVFPSLEKRLERSRLDELQRSATMIAADLPRSSFMVQGFSERAAAAVNARVVILQWLGPPLTFTLYADSGGGSVDELKRDRIALSAANSGQYQRGTTARDGSEYAEVAVPVARTSFIILVSAPLSGVHASVDHVRKRLLAAAIPCLALALLIGTVLAGWFTRRLRRLEQAADRIAGGSFDEPVADSGADEIGQLGRSFERMRVRLARLEEERREFIANASHELKTPIFALTGSLELLGDEEMDESSRRDFVETMRGQVERLNRLASDLLDLSRLDAGRLGLVPSALDLATLARMLQEEFEAAAELSGHPLSLTVAAQPLVLADERRVLEIGRNLIENALRHTPSGVRVRLWVAEEGEQGTLTVEDDGPGIPPEQQERIFERFFRLDDERASGSGLGLAIARELALRMNGEITVSLEDGSTRFTLSLPLAGADD